MAFDVVVRQIEPHATWPLRQLVLRPHQAEGDMEWPHDRADGAAHFGAFAEGALVGVASVVPEPAPDGGAALRLRGMAVHPDHQRQRVGDALLRECIAHAARQAASLWCNARVGVEEFYLRAGFVRTAPEPFLVPGVGPHVRMRR